LVNLGTTVTPSGTDENEGSQDEGDNNKDFVVNDGTRMLERKVYLEKWNLDRSNLSSGGDETNELIHYFCLI
jgi:hypothetical protein